MAKDKKYKKSIYEFFNKLGISKIYDIESAYKRKYGVEKAKELLETFDKLSASNSCKSNSDTEKKYVAEQTDLYDFLNSDFDFSMLNTSFSDADLIFNCCMWMMYKQDKIVSPAIDIGCGTGVITCYLASAFPEIKFVGIDRSQQSIKIAEQIKEKLNLNNIDFIHGQIDDITEKYNTVLSFRTIHENIGPKWTAYKYKSFSDQVEIYENLYKEYVSKISRLASPGASILAVERNEYDTDFLGLLTAFNHEGFAFLPDESRLLECDESDLVEKTVLNAFALNSEIISEEELFDRWASVSFNMAGVPTSAQADYILEMEGGKLISGYTSYDSFGTQSVYCAIYEIKDDVNSFLMYQANAMEKRIQVFPMSRKQEALSMFEDNKANDRSNGFKVVRLKANSDEIDSK